MYAVEINTYNYGWTVAFPGSVLTWIAVSHAFSSGLRKFPYRVREATRSVDKTTKNHKKMADSLIGLATYTALLSIGKSDPLSA